jgi:hypothetical protein
MAKKTVEEMEALLSMLLRDAQRLFSRRRPKSQYRT